MGNEQSSNGAGRGQYSQAPSEEQELASIPRSQRPSARGVRRPIQPQQAPRKPHESAHSARTRHQVASAAEARLKKKTAADISKQKRNRNMNLILAEEKDSDSSSDALKTCMLCGVVFRSETSLKQHLAKNHSPVKPSIKSSTSDANHDADMKQIILNSLTVLLENDAEVVSRTLSLFAGLCRNILKNADDSDDKYRKLRIANPRVQESVLGVTGAREALEAIGFRIQDFSGSDGSYEPHLFFSRETPTKNLEIALEAVKSLQT